MPNELMNPYVFKMTKWAMATWDQAIQPLSGGGDGSGRGRNTPACDGAMGSDDSNADDANADDANADDGNADCANSDWRTGGKYGVVRGSTRKYRFVHMPGRRKEGKGGGLGTKREKRGLERITKRAWK